MRHNFFFFAAPDDASTQGNSQAGAGSSRTPFDNSLLHDPSAPRDTQPLSPLNTANAATPAAPTPAAAPRTLPPQVLPGARVTHPSQNLSNNDDDTVQPSVTTYIGNKPSRKLPTSTLVGMSMAGGAVAVLIISILVRNVIPSPKTPETQTPGALPPATVNIKQQPGIVMTPDEETRQTTKPVPEQNPRETEQASSSAEVTITPEDAPMSSPDVGENSGDEATDNNSNVDDSSTEISRNNTTTRSRQRSASTRNNNNRDSTGSESLPRDEQTARNTSQPTRDETQSETRARDRVIDGRWTSARHGYSISPPEGFSLRRTGRRTAWRGPNGSEILVEVGAANGSPRSGWESLDRALSKKYGQKYRNRGIREVIINGRDAAIWEFDLDTKNGTVRKIDVAMHDGKRGYAVLGSAPVENFDAMRSQIESAVNSFRIENETNRSNTSSTRKSNDSQDDSADGY